MKKLLLIILTGIFLMSPTAWAISPAFLHQVVDGGGWRKCELTVNASKVPSDQTNFPVLLTEDTIPSESLDKDGSYPVDDGGGNMQFRETKAGGARYSCDPVTFTTDNNPANGVAEIHVKLPSVNGTTDTTFWMWYGKSGESQPAADAAYGSESVWDSNFKMVHHMEDTTTSTITDSTSNDNDGTKKAANQPVEATGKIGNGQDFDGTDDYIQTTSNELKTTDNFTVSFWFKADSTNIGFMVWEGEVAGNGFGPEDEFHIGTGSGTVETPANDGLHICLADDPNSSSSTVYATTTFTDTTNWHHLAGTIGNNITGKLYLDGVLQDTNSADNAIVKTGWDTNVRLGRPGASERYFNGKKDEIRTSNIIRSADWIEAGYNNQYDPSTFVTEGTPE